MILYNIVTRTSSIRIVSHQQSTSNLSISSSACWLFSSLSLTSAAIPSEIMRKSFQTSSVSAQVPLVCCLFMDPSCVAFLSFTRLLFCSAKHYQLAPICCCYTVLNSPPSLLFVVLFLFLMPSLSLTWLTL